MNFSLPAIALLALLSAAPVAASQQMDRLPFTGFREALETANSQRQVTVVYFTADWCVWCQRLERDTFRDERVLEAASGFQWAKVDVDVQPYLSAAMRVRGVPVLLLLNAEGEALDRHSGYMSPERFAQWLREHVAAAESPGQARRQFEQLVSNLEALEGDREQPLQRQAFIAIIEQVAAGEGGGRRAAQHATQRMGDAADVILVQLLSHQALAVRAAAFDLLRDRHDAGPAFDPFGEPDDRQRQQQAWMGWIAEHHGLDEAPDEADEPDSPEPEPTDATADV